MTTETNAERLEEIKKAPGVDYLLGGTALEVHWDWLIQQAERVLELEKTIAQRDSFIETLQVVHFKELAGEEAENARLREALEKITATPLGGAYTDVVEAARYQRIARQALKGESQ